MVWAGHILHSALFLLLALPFHPKDQSGQSSTVGERYCQGTRQSLCSGPKVQMWRPEDERSPCGGRMRKEESTIERRSVMNRL